MKKLTIVLLLLTSCQSPKYPVINGETPCAVGTCNSNYNGPCTCRKSKKGACCCPTTIDGVITRF